MDWFRVQAVDNGRCAEVIRVHRHDPPEGDGDVLVRVLRAELVAQRLVGAAVLVELAVELGLVGHGVNLPSTRRSPAGTRVQELAGVTSLCVRRPGHSTGCGGPGGEATSFSGVPKRAIPCQPVGRGGRSGRSTTFFPRTIADISGHSQAGTFSRGEGPRHSAPPPPAGASTPERGGCAQRPAGSHYVYKYSYSKLAGGGTQSGSDR